MSDPNRSDKPDRDPRRQPEFKIPPRTWIVWMVVITGIMTLLVFKDNLEPKPAVIPANDFLSMVDSNLIAAASYTWMGNYPAGTAHGVLAVAIACYSLMDDRGEH